MFPRYAVACIALLVVGCVGRNHWYKSDAPNVCRWAAPADDDGRERRSSADQGRLQMHTGR